MFALDPSTVGHHSLHAPPRRVHARVAFFTGERSTAKRLIRRLFNRPLDSTQLASLCGALDGADVEVGVYRNDLYLEFSDPLSHDYRGVSRVAWRLGLPVLAIDALHIHRAALRGRGLGLRIFSRQLAAAETLGITRIETRAGRRADENGYYTWPRYGFSGRLPNVLRRRLPLSLAGAVDVLDLMESAAGRSWWQLFGVSMRVVFDTRRNSRSRRAYEQYRAERKRPKTKPCWRARRIEKKLH